MPDFASIPGGEGDFLGTRGVDLLDADTDLPAALDNLIATFGGNDLIDAGLGDDLVYGGTGDDGIFGGAGNDEVHGGHGDDTVLGGSGDDLAYGNRGDDAVLGGTGNDVLFGNRGQDRVDGGAGNDILFGGRGDDTVIGGAGDDLLSGGRGADTFYFESGFGADVVLDFRGGEDMLAIKAGINGLPIGSTGDLAAYVGGNAAVATITLGADTIRLVSVARDDLLANLADYVKIV